MLQIASGLLNIYFMINYIVYQVKFDPLFPPINYFVVRGHFDLLYFFDYWFPMVGTTVSAMFLFIGGINALKNKNWGLVLTGALFTFLTPIVYQRIDISLITRILCDSDLIIGILIIIMTIRLRKYYIDTSKHHQNH